MAAPKTMTGARAKFGIYNPNTGDTKYLGIFNNLSWGLTYDAQPIYILGRLSPAEIEYTSQEPVHITASGWRVIDHGPHVDGQVPKLQDLLSSDYITLTAMDRQTGKNIATFRKVRCLGYSTTLASRTPEDITISFVAIMVDDESAQNADTGMDLP